MLDEQAPERWDPEVLSDVFALEGRDAESPLTELEPDEGGADILVVVPVLDDCRTDVLVDEPAFDDGVPAVLGDWVELDAVKEEALEPPESPDTELLVAEMLLDHTALLDRCEEEPDPSLLSVRLTQC